MYRRSLPVLLVGLLFALAPARGAFLDNDFSSTTELIDFNQFDSGYVTLTSNPVQVFQNGAFTISMNTPNAAESGQTVAYGAGTGPNYYLINQSQPGDQTLLTIDFSLAGGTVSSIGLSLSVHNTDFHTPIVLAIYDTNDLLLEAHTFSGWVGNGGSPLNPGGFYGFTSENANIARLSVTGGTIKLDDLRFGGLSLDEAPGDSEAVPEVSTFLLCASALGLLSLGRWRRSLREHQY